MPNQDNSTKQDPGTQTPPLNSEGMQPAGVSPNLSTNSVNVDAPPQPTPAVQPPDPLTQNSQAAPVPPVSEEVKPVITDTAVDSTKDTKPLTVQADDIPKTPDQPTSPNVDIPPVVATTKGGSFSNRLGKKKIATILGLLLLVGGVSTGVMLIQKQQNPEEKAYTTQGRKMTCSIGNLQFYVSEGTISESPRCDRIDQCGTDNQSGTNEIDSYSTTHNILIEPITEYTTSPGSTGQIQQNIVIKYYKNSNYCEDYACGFEETSGGFVCHDSPITDPADPSSSQLEATFTNYNTPQTITINRDSDNGRACGSFQTDVMITEVVGADECSWSSPSEHFLSEEPFVMSAGLCQTGISCETSPGAECLDVKAYAVEVGEGGNPVMDPDGWSRLSQNDLSSLEEGDVVYFTVTGKGPDLTKFTKAKFKVNDVVSAEVSATGHTKPRATTDPADEIEIFYRYVITSDTTFTVEGSIFHTDLGWLDPIN